LYLDATFTHEIFLWSPIMAITIDEARSTVMQLSPQDRQVLAYEILDSVEEARDIEDAAEMEAIIAERASKVHSGQFVAHDWKDTIPEMKDALQECRKSRP
jgi:hypothetical protein